MRIKSIKASNFKSLVDFRIELAQFNCLIGLNGSGKSTVLQFIDFISQLVRGDIKGWLNDRKWESSDLKSKLTREKNIQLWVYFADDHGNDAGQWFASYNPSESRCTVERITMPHAFLQVARGRISIKSLPDSQDVNGRRSEITFKYEGSILSALKEDLLPLPILEIKKLMKQIKSLDLLSPEYLRQRTRESDGSIGLGGQKLSAFLHEIGKTGRDDLTRHLKRIYPQFEKLDIKSLRSGWKQLEIREKYSGAESGLTTQARHINDGMLRLIAILAELQSDHDLLLFDEIENGINPELIEFVIETLTSTKKQVIVTTHSPMILNYLSDEIAIPGVIYLYKTSEGATEAINFFSIPSIAEKLTVMGPGEVFVDTNLTELFNEIQSFKAETQ